MRGYYAINRERIASRRLQARQRKALEKQERDQAAWERANGVVLDPYTRRQRRLKRRRLSRSGARQRALYNAEMRQWKRRHPEKVRSWKRQWRQRVKAGIRRERGYVLVGVPSRQRWLLFDQCAEASAPIARFASDEEARAYARAHDYSIVSVEVL